MAVLAVAYVALGSVDETPEILAVERGLTIVFDGFERAKSRLLP